MGFFDRFKKDKTDKSDNKEKSDKKEKEVREIPKDIEIPQEELLLKDIAMNSKNRNERAVAVNNITNQ